MHGEGRNVMEGERKGIENIVIRKRRRESQERQLNWEKKGSDGRNGEGDEGVG